MKRFWVLLFFCYVLIFCSCQKHSHELDMTGSEAKQRSEKVIRLLSDFKYIFRSKKVHPFRLTALSGMLKAF
jgi:hypothetical protein